MWFFLTVRGDRRRRCVFTCLEERRVSYEWVRRRFCYVGVFYIVFLRIFICRVFSFLYVYLSLDCKKYFKVVDFNIGVIGWFRWLLLDLEFCSFIFGVSCVEYNEKENSLSLVNLRGVGWGDLGILIRD